MAKFKSLSLLLGVGVLAVSLASCTPETTTTTTTTSEEPPTTTTTTSEDSLPEWVDYVHSGEVQLTLDYEGHDFYQDGIGQMTLQYEAQCIDGDTVHFTPLVTTTSSERIKSRFYGVDTPEVQQLICANNSLEKVREYIGADYLGFLSLKGLKESIGDEEYCQACFDGCYIDSVHKKQ